MNLHEAEQLAARLLRLLEPYCVRIDVGGSIRRQKMTDIKDIEIIAAPKMLPDPSKLFEDGAQVSALDRYLGKGDAVAGLSRDDQREPCWGPKSKRLRYSNLGQEMPVDLFIVTPPAQWGLILCLRTGPSDFSRNFVTHRSKGGFLPDDMRVIEGHLERSGKPIDTPHEADVFAACKLPYLKAVDRQSNTAFVPGGQYGGYWTLAKECQRS